MQALRPQFTFHEQELRFQQLPFATSGQEAAQEQALEGLQPLPGVTIESQDKLAVASVDMAAYRLKSDGSDFDAIAQRATTLLRMLNGLGQYDSTSIDPVIGIDELDRTELHVTVGADFQAWAEHGSSTRNSIPLTELALRDPFFRLIKGSTARNTDEKPRVYFANHRADAIHTDPVTGVMRSGTHVWQVPFLQTLGERTRLGLTQSESISVKLPEEATALYELRATNVSSPMQTLSFICGLGALAHAAVEGTRKHIPVTKLFSWADGSKRR